MGAYRIEERVYGCSVHKALGPWPFKNWSLISFYEGGRESCEAYIRWAQRVDSRERVVMKDCSNWLELHFMGSGARVGPETALHMPKTLGYPFRRVEGIIDAEPASSVDLKREWGIFAPFVKKFMRAA